MGQVVWGLVIAAIVLTAEGTAEMLHVSTAANDDGDGSETRPFATLQAARDAVRERVRDGLRDDVAVSIRSGTYYLPEGILFGPEDSGTDDHSITWRAAAGHTVRLVGGVQIDGWEREEGAIRTARMPAGIATRQVFEGGRRLALARTPDEGYLRMDGPVEGREKTGFSYAPADLDLHDVDLTGGRVFLWPGHDWFTQDKPIISVDPDARVIRMEGDGGYDMKPTNRYFLYNVRSFLDRPGESYIDSAAARLSVWPSTGEPIEVSSAPHVIAVRGTDDNPVRNLHFVDLDIVIAEEDAILFEGVLDCSVQRCLIANARRNGVSIVGAARRVAVHGNEIRQHGQHGVVLQGMGPPGPDVNTDHRVANNHIHHCGRLVGHGYGVRLGQSGRNLIVHNHIHHMPRYGTTIKGTRYQVLRTQFEGVTFENRHDFLHSRENIFAYNHIHDVNEDSQDTGAMESWGSGRDNVYDHNLIHDTGNDRFNLQSGIYLDDASDYFTVTNNIIYGVGGTGGDQAIFAKGIGHRIENNILIVEPTNVAAIRSMTMAGERADGHEYARNIVYFEPPPPPPAGAFGARLRNLHAVGTKLTWDVEIPESGDYAFWLRYTTSVDVSGKSELAVDDDDPARLPGLRETGGWDHWEWRRVTTLSLRQGTRRLTWVNRDGGPIDLDALALCDDPQWQPQGVELMAPASNHLVVVQAETSPSDRRAFIGFINYSDDRVARSDSNLTWNGPRDVRVEGGPGSGTLDRWRALGHDGASRVADPLFIDADARDYRLRPESPALELGFVPIETDGIGLEDDFPTRLARDTP